MFSGIGSAEILVILLVALVFFGPKKLAEIARSAGKAARYIRRTISQIEREIASEIPDDDRPSPTG